jgi:hypothetical protein
MVSRIVSLVCVVCLFLLPAVAQTTVLEPLRYPTGAVLEFHLQTRFNPEAENEVDSLPKGTLLRVKLLSPVDSDSAQDGSEIRGVITAAVLSGDKVVVHPNAEAQVLFVVLRNRTHPQGFRYELLVTKITDAGRSLDLTASLSSSFAEDPSAHSGDAKPAAVAPVGIGEAPVIPRLKGKSAN